MEGLTFAEEMIVAVVGGMIAAGGGGFAVYTQLGVAHQRREVRNGLLSDKQLHLEIRRTRGLAYLQAHDLANYKRLAAERDFGALCVEALSNLAASARRGSAWDSHVLHRAAKNARKEAEPLARLALLIGVQRYVERRLRTSNPIFRVLGAMTERIRRRDWARKLVEDSSLNEARVDVQAVQ